MALVFFAGTAYAYAEEPVMITLSVKMINVVFDGKWSYMEEWKESTLNSLTYDDGSEIELRTAHNGNFIYVMIDDVTGTNYQKGSDYAMICFDTSKVRPEKPNSNDYCFANSLGRSEPMTLQGGSPMALGGNFKRVANPIGLVGVSAVSDVNDRYSTDPHSSYEFRIPLDQLGRLDHYGFYMQVYDAGDNKFYTYPRNVPVASVFDIPAPKLWGGMISPDESLPEFPLPAFLLVSAFSFLILIYIRASPLFSFKTR